MSTRLSCSAILITAAGLLTACSNTLLSDMKMPDLDIPLLSQVDQHLPKITPDANIPILLSSNKQDTAFTVNGMPLDRAKFMKVLVPPTDLRITAQAPCYRLKEQTASSSGFGRSSQFDFTFTTWDKDPRYKNRNCS